MSMSMSMTTSIRPLEIANCYICNRAPRTAQGCHHETETLTAECKRATSNYYRGPLKRRIQELEKLVAEQATTRVIAAYNVLVARRRQERRAAQEEAERMPCYAVWAGWHGAPPPSLVHPKLSQDIAVMLDYAERRYERKKHSDWKKCCLLYPQYLADIWLRLSVMLPLDDWGVREREAVAEPLGVRVGRQRRMSYG
ncbi:hypothetical protein CAC42_2314 [Sphaceloma murrayae]|uniref:Uncharacterized protein n=1 Tax=Sphaceloma murrayae TaxID=2082308 RepID=A0A2K1QIU4_9PEZI|nr:hypothetical protein CAC42_2314 [Sphaceloma murrayae]